MGQKVGSTQIFAEKFCLTSPIIRRVWMDDERYGCGQIALTGKRSAFTKFKSKKNKVPQEEHKSKSNFATRVSSLLRLGR